VYRERGEAANSVKDYSKAIELGIQNDSIYKQRADVYYDSKQYQLALSDYTLLLTQYKKRHAELYSKRGVCYTSLGDSIAAQKDFTKAIQLDKSDYAVYLYRAENFVKLKKMQSAISDYNRAIELKPKAWDIYFSRAKVYLEQKKYELAIEDFSTAVKYNSKLAEAYFLRGSCKDALKDINGACADLKKAAALHHQEAIKSVGKYCR